MVTLIWSTSKQHTHHPKKENKGVFFSKIDGLELVLQVPDTQFFIQGPFVLKV